MIPYWLRWGHLVYLVRWRFVGLFQRAWRGWADVDTWGYDHYLAQTIAPALRHMAQHAHGHPMFIYEQYPGLVVSEDALPEESRAKDAAAFEAWQHWLIEKATWFEWYDREDMNLSPDMTDDQKLSALDLYEKQMKNFEEHVMADFGKRFGNLWD